MGLFSFKPSYHTVSHRALLNPDALKSLKLFISFFFFGRCQERVKEKQDLVALLHYPHEVPARTQICGFTACQRRPDSCFDVNTPK